MKNARSRVPDPTTMGETILKLRQFLDLTQSQLAKEMGVSENTLHLAERDKRILMDKRLAGLTVALEKAGVRGVTPSVMKLLCDPSDDPNVVKLKEIAAKLLEDQLAAACVSR